MFSSWGYAAHPQSHATQAATPSPSTQRAAHPAAGPPFPLLALLVLLLLGTRSGSWLPGIGLLAVATLLATLHARGLRVVMRVGASHVLLLRQCV